MLVPFRSVLFYSIHVVRVSRCLECFCAQSAQPFEEEGQCATCGLPTVVNPSDELLTALLCEGCECEVHLRCAGKDTIPEGDWFCASCSSKYSGFPPVVPAPLRSSPAPLIVTASASSTTSSCLDYDGTDEKGDAMNVTGRGSDEKPSEDGMVDHREYTSKHTVYRCTFRGCGFVSMSREALREHRGLHDDSASAPDPGVTEDGENLKFIDEGARARVPSQRQILRLMPDHLRRDLNETGLIDFLENLTELFQNLAGPDSGHGQTFNAVMCRVQKHILKDRRITTRSPEWRVCRDLLGVVNASWHIPLTSIEVDGIPVNSETFLFLFSAVRVVICTCRVVSAGESSRTPAACT